MVAIAVAAAPAANLTSDMLDGAQLLTADESAVSEWLAGESANRLVIYSDGISPEQRDTLARAVEPNRHRVLEVRGERWDGFTHSTLSGAVRGVIGGFGERGLRPAIQFLRDL